MLFRPTTYLGNSQLGRCRTCIVMALALALISSTGSNRVSAQTDASAVSKEQAAAKSEASTRYEAFAKKLSGSTLQGLFSVDGQQGPLKEEKYEIQTVTKLPSGDLWLFKVRIRYGDHDVNVPLPLTVSWAGKTPVIVVDQVTIPGLGTFDSRVVIAGQRYAGTWQHGDAGGHLFGKIIPAKARATDKE